MQCNFNSVISRVKEVMQGDSVYAFAKKLGISQQTVDCYINGSRKPSLDFIYRVCSVCKCSADWLMGLTDESTPPPLEDRTEDLKREIEAVLKKF